MKEQQLSASQVKHLRESGVLQENEIAFIAGDLVVAENILTLSKRIIGESSILSESNKRILKG